MSQRNLTLLATLLACFLAAPRPTLADAGAATDHPTIKAWLEAWNTGTDNLGSFLTEDVTFEEPFHAASDRKGYRDIILTSRATLRDMEMKVEDVILDGDRGAVSFSGSAVHNHTGKPVHVRGVSILRFRDGKIAAEWRVYDGAQLLRQLGVLPADGDGASN